MENTAIMEEDMDTEVVYEPSGGLILNGEAWKDRGNTTYTSLLDRYGAADLFSSESMEGYRRLEEEKRAEQRELTEYVFSGQMQTKSQEENLIELIFSQEIQFSKLGDYSRNEEDYTICFVMAEILFVLVFLYLLIRINARRRKRRESYAIEIDLEG